MLHVTLSNIQFLTYSSVISVPTLLFCGDIHFVAITALGSFRPCLFAHQRLQHCIMPPAVQTAVQECLFLKHFSVRLLLML
jgi:molybdenum cofactor biosynthesis enzyme MoaA